MMCGLLTPDEGKGTCLGYNIRKQQADIKARVGYMTQKFSLYEDLTIRENLDFVARMYGIKNRNARVTHALEDLGLLDRANQLAGTLSGGWKQRLALAACIIHDPDLLLLDEPTAGVDPKARRDFWDEIRRLAAQGVTVLVSTHYMDEAVQCDNITYIAYGRKLIDGPSHDIPHQIGLKSWRVTGSDIGKMEATLRAEAKDVQVNRFGAVLHVSGRDEKELAALAEKHGKNEIYKWVAKESELEDAFIYLMAGAKDNFGDHHS